MSAYVKNPCPFFPGTMWKDLKQQQLNFRHRHSKKSLDIDVVTPVNYVQQLQQKERFLLSKETVITIAL